MRPTVILILVASAVALPAAATQAGAKPAFEVATIKPSDPNANGSSGNTRNNRLTIRNWTLKRLVQRAYGVKDFQVTGGPNWADLARYDVSAKEEDGMETLEGKERQQRLMAELWALLADRFQLTVHSETKTLAVYHLITAKSGFKLTGVASPGSSSTNSNNTQLTAKGLSMAGFADWLSDRLERPVLDASEVSGAFDFKLEWSPQDGPTAKTPEANTPAGPSIFTAIQEQLGLKLEAGKGPVEIIVIDHAEKPTEN